MGKKIRFTRKTEKNPKAAEIIGIAGSSRGVGVTHFSIMTANYLYGVKNRRTVVLEWNDSGDFQRIEEICCKNPVPKPTSETFNILEVSYVKRAGKTELLKCINQEYDAIVIDFGSDFKKIREEFLRCNRKILIGSFSEWKIGAFIALISGKKSKDGRWFFLAAPGNHHMREEVGKMFHITIRQLPESEDAFEITGDNMAFFGGFLK